MFVAGDCLVHVSLKILARLELFYHEELFKSFIFGQFISILDLREGRFLLITWLNGELILRIICEFMVTYKDFKLMIVNMTRFILDCEASEKYLLHRETICCALDFVDFYLFFNYWDFCHFYVNERLRLWHFFILLLFCALVCHVDLLR